MSTRIIGSVARALTILVSSILVLLVLVLLIWYDAWLLHAVVRAALERAYSIDDLENTFLPLTFVLLLLGALATAGMAAIGLAMRTGSHAGTGSNKGILRRSASLLARAQARHPVTATGIELLGKGITCLGIPAIALALIAAAAQLVDLVFNLFVAVFQPDDPERINTVLDYLGMLYGGVFAGLIAMAVGLRIERFARRLRTRPAEALLADPKAAITVYLRPFDIDARHLRDNAAIYGRGPAVRIANVFMRLSHALDVIPGPGTWLRWTLLRMFGSRVEECIVDDLQQLGSVVAIGRPGEALPELGASRLYARDDEWQSRVLEMLRRASAVVLVAGDSQGVKWELREVLSSVPLDRVALYLPFWAEKNAGTAADAYARFLKENEGLLPCEFPRRYERTMFLCFERRDDRWFPRRIFAANTDSHWEALVSGTKQLVQHFSKPAEILPPGRTRAFLAQLR